MSQQNTTIDHSIGSAADSSRFIAELREVVTHGQRRWKRLILLEAVGVAIAAPLAYLWLVFLVDDVVHLNRFGRLMAILIFFGVIAWLGVRLVNSWKRANFTEDQVALAIERRTTTGVQNRLINAIQLSRDDRVGKTAMSRAVLEENYRMLKQVELQQSAEAFPATVRIAIATVLIVIGLAYYSLGGEHFRRSAARIFMPLADIEPIYRTTLDVRPGDANIPLGGDLEITIAISGEMPDRLTLLTDDGAQQASKELRVAAANESVTYTFENVKRPLAYAVRGNDYTSRFFKISVPTPLQLDRVRTAYQYPDYTGLSERRVEAATGDLEALAGTTAALEFVFNKPLKAASMVLYRPNDKTAANGADATGDRFDPATHTLKRVALKQIDDRTFSGSLAFRDVVGYQLESTNAAGQTIQSPAFVVRIKADAAPELELVGVEPTKDVMIDTVQPLGVTARDDYGLAEVGLFYRRIKPAGALEAPVLDPQTGQVTTQPTERAHNAADWQPIQRWTVDGNRLEFITEHTLPIGMLDVVEGEVIEVAPRGRDNDPAKADVWTTGSGTKLAISGTGVQLQLKYEAILRTEKALGALIEGHEQLMAKATHWAQQLDPVSGKRWDDEKNLATLHTAMKDLAAAQSALREYGSDVARTMVPEAGMLQMSVGMLSDTEMVRSIRIIETVERRETPREKRLAVSDARLTQERTIRSLREIREQYIAFREDWELSHMLPFTKMLSDRQSSMADASMTYAGLSSDVVGDAQQQSVSRRQVKLRDLTGLTEAAFAGLATRPALAGEEMAEAFGAAADAFKEFEIQLVMQDAAKSLATGDWAEAEPLQREASESLTAIYADLRQAQSDLALAALANLKELEESGVDVQAALAQLKQGETENWLDMNPDELSLADTMLLQKLADDLRNKKQERGADSVFEDYNFDDKLRAALASGPAKKQEREDLSLADKPGGQMSIPQSSDREGNRVKPQIQEEFDNLVGELLEEADDVREQFETYNINTGIGISESGDVGKQGGDLNSTAAASVVGNMKPPTNNIGGASRGGRQGARAHGMAVGDESTNRRGRDEVQEGQEDVADQGGKMSNTDSGDPQKDASTGRGGKLVGHEDTSFSTKDAGEFRDEDVDRLLEPKDKHNIVERQGKPLDPRVAAKMYDDTASDQEQVIARIKAVRKQLDKLYLPSDHLEEIEEKLAANLDRLKDNPDPDVFRQQAELLDQLKSTVVVFRRPSSEFEQSMQRDQKVRGRILDEPATQTLPGYEEAVNRYYEKLSGM